MNFENIRSIFHKISYKKLKKSLCSCLIFALFLPCLLVVTIFSYATFYHLYIPLLLTEFDLNFLIQKDLYRRAIVNFDHLMYEPLDARVTYSISLELCLPESSINQQLGMLMVGLTLRSKTSNHSTEEMLRTTMLEYKSSLHQQLETILSLPLYLLTHHRQMQTLHVIMIDDFVENYYHRSSEAIVMIYSKSVQLYGGRMRINALFSGMRYLVYHWCVTSAIFGIVTSFTGLLLVTSLIWLFYFIRKVVRDDDGGGLVVVRPAINNESTFTGTVEVTEPSISSTPRPPKDKKSL